MSAFEVTPAQLQSLAGQLTGLLSELETAGGTVRSVSGEPAGHTALETAIESFVDEWSATVELLHEKLSTLSTRLGAAGSSYEDSEQEIIKVVTST